MKKTYMTPVAEEIRMEKVLLSTTSTLEFKGTTNKDSDLLGRDFDFEDEE